MWLPMTVHLPSVDWEYAGLMGRRFAAAGLEYDRFRRSAAGQEDPQADTHERKIEIEGVVAGLHEAADRAIDLIGAASGLDFRAKPPVYAVDRATWAQANTQLAGLAFDRLRAEPPSTLLRKVSRRTNAVLAAGMLTALGRRVLGQYDPLTPGGRLLLVVPNVIGHETRWSLVPQDFRLWVALHEQTHAVQFGAAPWLTDHLVELTRRIAADPGVSWVGKLSPASSQDASDAIDQVMAVMTFLEGHAEVMTDLVGRNQIGTWERLRRIFDTSRATKKSRWLAKMGVVGKAEQYDAGASFCRAILDDAGVGVLNRAFDDPHWLPAPSEIADPGQWLRRVDG